MDGQTEVLNATIEQMLQVYVAGGRESWAKWLSELCQSYNSAKHLLMGYRPDELLLGYKLAITMGVYIKNEAGAQGRTMNSLMGEMEYHRQLARDSLAAAQERQICEYNKKR